MPLTTLLHGRHEADPKAPSVKYQDFGPWLVPWTFSSFQQEYDALRAKTGLVDYSICAFLECQGADRVEFLHRLLTNDLRRLAPGASCPAALLNPQGKLIAELLVIATEHSLWLMCDVRQADVLFKTLEGYHFSEQVTLINHERRYAMLGLHGPALPEHLLRLWPHAPKLAHDGDHAVMSWDGVPLWLLRYAPLGGKDPDLMVLAPAEEAVKVWHRLSRQIEPAGWEAANAVRLENGCPWQGIDYDETTLLGEVGLDRILVSGTKGCYIGQEIVARMETYGSPSRKLMQLITGGPADAVPQAGDQIMRAHEPVGRVTSGSRSPKHGHPIAFGYIKRGANDSGTALEILRNDQRLPAAIRENALVA
jgi:folate-binding protein YgfZ